jgi:hypothetical protein
MLASIEFLVGVFFYAVIACHLPRPAGDTSPLGERRRATILLTIPTVPPDADIARSWALGQHACPILHNETSRAPYIHDLTLIFQLDMG